MPSLKQARKLLGSAANKLTDQQIIEIIHYLEQLAHINLEINEE